MIRLTIERKDSAEGWLPIASFDDHEHRRGRRVRYRVRPRRWVPPTGRPNL